METIVFIERALFVFAESLWVVYLVLAAFVFFTKYVCSQKTLNNFKKLKFAHRYILLVLILSLCFLQITPFGTLDRGDKFLVIAFFLLAMGSYALLKYAIFCGLKSLSGKKVMVVICYADDEVVEYSICYKRKMLSYCCCPRKCWGNIKVNSGDMLPAVMVKADPKSEKFFDVKLIKTKKDGYKMD